MSKIDEIDLMQEAKEWVLDYKNSIFQKSPLENRASAIIQNFIKLQEEK